MTDRELRDMQQELRDIRKLLHGDPSSASGGLAHSVLTIGETLFGRDGSGKSGLVADNEQYKKIVWSISGATVVLQILLQVAFHFWK